jgi:hypothetical protein
MNAKQTLCKSHLLKFEKWPEHHQHACHAAFETNTLLRSKSAAAMPVGKHKGGGAAVETYTDAAISGAGCYPTAFQKVITHTSKYKFDIVICETIDRLERRLVDTADLQDQLAFKKSDCSHPH